jgi:hypothetical protein
MSRFAALNLAALLLPVIVAAAPAPILDVDEPALGSWSFEGTADPMVLLQVTTVTELSFSWLGDASGYGGTVTGYRYGWDVADPDDFNDPGWATAGYELDLLSAPPRSFLAGVHTLYVAAIDDAQGLTWAGFLIQVEPPVSVTASTWGAVKVEFAD